MAAIRPWKYLIMLKLGFSGLPQASGGALDAGNDSICSGNAPLQLREVRGHVGLFVALECGEGAGHIGQTVQFPRRAEHGEAEPAVQDRGKPRLPGARAESGHADPARIDVRPSRQVIQGPQGVEHLDPDHRRAGRRGNRVQPGVGRVPLADPRVFDEQHDQSGPGRLLRRIAGSRARCSGPARPGRPRAPAGGRPRP